MSLINAKNYLKKYNLDSKIIEFKTSSATVALAAKALDVEEGSIAKTISLYGKINPILVVASGVVKIDNQKFKQQFGFKAKMINFTEVLDLIGHDIGGVCPFGVNKNVEVFLDISLKKFTSVFPACGSSNSVIELNIKQLEEVSGYKNWVDVCKEA